MVIFYPCSIPCFLAITGRIARKKNKHQRTRLLRIIQAILFHTDIWYNAPFQFSDHFLCQFVTRPSPGQSCMLFPCTQKADQGLEGCFLHCSLKTALDLWPNLLVLWPCVAMTGELQGSPQGAGQNGLFIFFHSRNPYCY